MTIPNTEERKSKSQMKREMLALQELGKRLLNVPDGKLDALPITDTLRDAVILAKKLTREAFRRQMQHIGGLMREADSNAIRRALDGVNQPEPGKKVEKQEVEKWRDELVDGADNLLNELVSRFEMADRGRLRQLVRNAKKERDQNKPPKSANVLFKYLLELRS